MKYTVEIVHVTGHSSGFIMELDEEQANNIGDNFATATVLDLSSMLGEDHHTYIRTEHVLRIDVNPYVEPVTAEEPEDA